MSDHRLIMRRLAVVAHPKLPESIVEAVKVAAFLQNEGIEATSGLIYDEDLRHRITQREFDVLIALGGDGTMLRAGHLCGPLDIPILGINLGHFGFLMEIHRDEWRPALTRLLKGDYWLENRMMLRAELWRQESLLNSWHVVNEICVSRGQVVRPIHINTSIDGRFLTTYVADALLAATPTGSTAYALAAGGPILPPELRNILLVAVAPHLSLDRAVVLAEGSSVTMSIQSNHQAVLSIDGQAPIHISSDERLEACAGEHSLHLVRFQDPAYFYRNLISCMNQNPTTGNSR